MRRRLKFSAIGVVLTLSMATAVGADNDKSTGKAKGKGHDNGAPAAEVEHGHGDVVVVFNDRDRDEVHRYWVDSYGRGNCPPGLAKKHNGCLPPGQAKKRYVVGQRLPATVVIRPLPPVLVTRLGPPSGYQYAVVDGDVIKLAVGTRLVVDAITALLN
jgi:hypothetical protein